MTNRDRNMLLAVLAIVSVVGFYMFLLKPQQAAVKDAKAQVDSARQTLSQAQQQATSGRAAEDAYRRDRATIIKIGRVVPESDDIATLQVQLSQLAKKEHVYFTDFTLTGGGSTAAAGATTTTTTPSGAEAGGTGSTSAVAPLYPPGSVQMVGGLGRTPLEIGLKGTYFSLERFLRAVQRFAVVSAGREDARGRLMVVDGFTYGGSDQVRAYSGGKITGTQTYIEAKLSASVYFAPPLAPPASAGPGGSASGAPGATPTTPGAASGQPATGAATVGGIQ